MKLAIIYLAALGFLVSASVHVAALLGVVFGGDGLLSAYFGGAMLLFIPTVLILRTKFPGSAVRITWQEMLAACPVPVRVLFYAVFFYAFANFFAVWIQGAPTKHSSGEPLTVATVRGFSGHAMVFYMVSFTTMLSMHRGEKKDS